MRILEKNYEYLLLNLIPQHRLGVERRRSLETAIRSGETGLMRRAAIAALEDLCEAGYYERARVDSLGDRITATYTRRGGHYQIQIDVPAREWRRRNGPGPSTPAAEPSPGIDTTFAILPDIIRSLSIDSRLESTLERLQGIVTALPQWLGVEAGRLLVAEERLGHEEELRGVVTTLPERAVLAKGLYARCHRSQQPEILGAAAARALGVAEPGGSGALRDDFRVAAVPVFSAGEFWGILELWIDRSMPERDVRARIDAARGMVEQTITNASRLENLTSVDKLTGVYNRNHYEAQVQIEIERATRSKSKLSMLVLDIDDFKKINDTHGHRTGDEALTLVAKLVKKNLRKIDLAFRYGGEEFVVLLPGTSQVEANHTAERLRSVIAETESLRDEDGARISLRVSIGAAVFPEHATSEGELFARADSALYRAKRMGKNRVEFYSSE